MRGRRVRGVVVVGWGGAGQQMGSLFWLLLMVETKRGHGLRRGQCFCLYLLVVVVVAISFSM